MSKYRWLWAAAGLWLGGMAPELGASASAAGRAGSPFGIHVWENDDGLPQSSVFAIVQSRDGYLWLGTANGLVRFDGMRFTVFDENNTPGLHSSRIVQLLADRQDRLWIGTENGGVSLVQNGKVFSLATGDFAPKGKLAAIGEDARGAVWLHTDLGELWRYAGRDHVSSGPLPPEWRLIADVSGPVWAGRSGFGLGNLGVTAAGALELKAQYDLPIQVLKFLLASPRGGYWRLADGKIQKWTTNRLERDLGPYPWKPETTVTAACEDPQGNLVVGTQGEGIFWFDAAGRATGLSTNEGLSSSFILSLCVDREGSLWVGTDGRGLNRIQRQVFEVLDASRGLVVQSTCADGQGGLWMGFNTIGPEACRAGWWHAGALQPFGSAQGLLNAVRAMFVDARQRVWAGTLLGLAQLHGDVFRPAEGADASWRIAAIYQDRRGRLWFGAQRWDDPQRSLTNELASWEEGAPQPWTSLPMPAGVRAIVDDAEGNLWVGTAGAGLHRLRNGVWTAYRKSDGLPNENVTSLLADRDGVLWIGTDGGGLGRLRQGKWTRITTREGLVSNSLGFLVEDEQGNLWIGSNAGLMRVAKQALNDFAEGPARMVPCRAYGRADGLPTGECTTSSQPGACYTQDGTLWVPTVQGLAFVKPALLKTNEHAPPVVIESVLFQGQPKNTNALGAGPPRAVTIPARKEGLEIHFTSLNLAAPERARFKYRLERHETAWTEAGNERIARYSKLPPGDYRFQVTACNEDGVWNPEGSSLEVIVVPPFWQTGGFVGSAALLLLGAIVGVVHFFSTQKLQRQLERLRHEEALERERDRIARDLHDQVGASLTQVALLGELVEADQGLPREIEGHARQICQTARDTTRVLDEIVWTVNPSNDTLDGLVNYICKNAQDFFGVAGLRYRLEIPAPLPAIPIAPDLRHNVFLAAKEAVTNVVRHARATSAWIRLRLEPARFTLEIEDNGRGLAGLDPHTTRQGLRNMRQRLEAIGGEFFVGPGAAGGTLVRLTAPLAKR